MAKDKKDTEPQFTKTPMPSNLSRRFVEIAAEDQKGLIYPALVKPKLNEAEAQKVHQDVLTFGSGVLKIDGDKINHVPIETIFAKKRGPKPSGKAKSNAERVAAYRAKKRGEK